MFFRFSQMCSGLGKSMMLMMRVSAVILLCISCQIMAKGDASNSLTLTLLGTGGGPGGNMERAGIASLLTVNQSHYLFDAGEGLSRQLAHVGIKENQIERLFLTHLHDDHTAGLPAFMTFAYTLRSQGVTVYGPPRTQALVEGVLDYMALNAEIRMAERRLPAAQSVFTAKEMVVGDVYKDANVQIDATQNSHFHLTQSPIASRNQSYAYRVDTAQGSLVFSGDTGPSKAVEALAKGADVLIAEMVSMQDVANIPNDVLQHMLAEHLSADEVGKLAHNAGVKYLILSHIRHVAQADVAKIKQHFDGELIVGQDLATFTLTAGQLKSTH